MIEWSQIKNFRPAEFNHPDSLDPKLIRWLDRARQIAGIPFEITSDFRPGDPRAHGLGKAVDIRARSSRARKLIVEGLLAAGFNRIGIYDKHIHADVADGPDFPQNVIWLGTSK